MNIQRYGETIDGLFCVRLSKPYDHQFYVLLGLCGDEPEYGLDQWTYGEFRHV